MSPPHGDHDLKDLHSKQWKQALASAFWKSWFQEYLVSRQPRPKWHVDKPNLAKGDVFLKDAQVKQNEWPVGLVMNAIPVQDKKVWKVDVKVVRHTPVSEVVLLLKGAQRYNALQQVGRVFSSLNIKVGPLVVKSGSTNAFLNSYTGSRGGGRVV